MDSKDTASITGGPGPHRDELAAPPKSLGHYTLGEKLGAGGMATVFKAYDEALRRPVALKFLHASAAAQEQRFKLEAQAQARVVHENVCQVYEVGEADGRPYIALQFIEGMTLGAARAQMTVRERVSMLVQVAEAVHTAHAIGLIHRDLKPANVLVERTERGWKPYVTDFGLARDLETPGETVSGVILGTPHYMAPEQTRAERGSIDRRTDVYGLGATLYELLLGRPPFEGANVLAVLSKSLREEPTLPRSLDRSLPIDLQSVVLKCLEKDPQRRYQSARALADDLRRWLDGDPVQARAIGLGQRLWRRARRNRLAFSIGATAALLVLVAGVLALREKILSTARAELSRRFGQEAKELELTLRIAAMMPLHDIRGERGEVRARMRALRLELAGLNSAAAAPGHYALGRGHLALEELEAARTELETALNDGAAGAETHLALGETLGALYRDALELAYATRSKLLRETRLRELERMLRDPALVQLKLGAPAAGPAADYAASLIAFEEKRYAEALAGADRSLKRVPSLYEAAQLAGSVEIARGDEQALSGAYDDAAQSYQRAGDSFLSAEAVGRSDETVYASDCHRWSRVTDLEERRGKLSVAIFEHARPSCENAVAVDPESGRAVQQLSRLEWKLCDFQMTHGLDAAASCEQAVAHGELAVKLGPSVPLAHISAALAHWTKAELISTRADPLPEYQRALALLDRARELAPEDANVPIADAEINAVLADYEMRHGIEARPALDRSIAQHRRALQLAPALPGEHGNAGAALTTAGDYELRHGLDAEPSLRAALDEYAAALKINPKNVFVHNNIGETEELLARIAVEKGEDPGPAIERAKSALQAALNDNPKFHYAYAGLGHAARLAAEEEERRGRDPLPSLEEAEADYRKALEISPAHGSALRGIGQAWLARARHALSRSADPGAAISQGEQALAQALHADPADAEAALALGELHLCEASWARHLARNPRPALAKAESSLLDAQKIDRFSAPVLVALAELHASSAEGADAGREQDQAAKFLNQALAINPKLAEALALKKKLAGAPAK